MSDATDTAPMAMAGRVHAGQCPASTSPGWLTIGSREYVDGIDDEEADVVACHGTQS